MYCVRPAERCCDISSASLGLAQGLKRATVTRGVAAGPHRIDGRSMYNSLSSSRQPSGVSVAKQGTPTKIFKGPV